MFLKPSCIYTIGLKKNTVVKYVIKVLFKCNLMYRKCIVVLTLTEQQIDRETLLGLTRDGRKTFSSNETPGYVFERVGEVAKHIIVGSVSTLRYFSC